MTQTEEPSLAEKLMAEGAFGMSIAARRMPVCRADRPCHPSTVARWCIEGVPLADGRRLRLESFTFSGKRMTSQAAITRFVLAQQTQAGADEPVQSPAGRSKAAAKAEAELAAMGC